MTYSWIKRLQKVFSNSQRGPFFDYHPKIFSSANHFNKTEYLTAKISKNGLSYHLSPMVLFYLIRLFKARSSLV